jgi:hypothetical protein
MFSLARSVPRRTHILQLSLAMDLAANMTLSCGSNATECNMTGGNFTWPDEADLWSEPQYYSYRYRAVGTFFQGIVLVIGVLGNVMVVVVVRRTQSMHSPTNCYLVSFIFFFIS